MDLATKWIWSEESHLLAELGKRGLDGPLLVKAAGGIYDTSLCTLSAQQILLLHKWEENKRVIAKTKDGLQLTIPISHRARFEVYEEETSQESLGLFSLEDIVELFVPPVLVKFDPSTLIEFYIQDKLQSSKDLGFFYLNSLHYIDYFKASSIDEEGRIRKKLLTIMPSHLDVGFFVAEGLRNYPEDYFHDLVKEISRQSTPLVDKALDIYSFSGIAEYDGALVTPSRPGGWGVQQEAALEDPLLQVATGVLDSANSPVCIVKAMPPRSAPTKARPTITAPKNTPSIVHRSEDDDLTDHPYYEEFETNKIESFDDSHGIYSNAVENPTADTCVDDVDCVYSNVTENQTADRKYDQSEGFYSSSIEHFSSDTNGLGDISGGESLYQNAEYLRSASRPTSLYGGWKRQARRYPNTGQQSIPTVRLDGPDSHEKNAGDFENAKLTGTSASSTPSRSDQRRSGTEFLTSTQQRAQLRRVPSRENQVFRTRSIDKAPTDSDSSGVYNYETIGFSGENPTLEYGIFPGTNPRGAAGLIPPAQLQSPVRPAEVCRPEAVSGPPSPGDYEQTTFDSDAPVPSFETLSKVPKDISTLGVSDVSKCLSLLKLGRFVDPFAQARVDGSHLSELTKESLMEQFNMGTVSANKVVLFAKGGLRQDCVKFKRSFRK